MYHHSQVQTCTFSNKCQTCNSVKRIKRSFESTCKDIQLIMKKLHKNHQQKNDNIQRIPQKLSRRLSNQEGTYKTAIKYIQEHEFPKCLQKRVDEQLLKQNFLLNKYFDYFEEKYKIQKNEVCELRSQNNYLKEMVRQKHQAKKRSETVNNKLYDDREQKRFSFLMKPEDGVEKNCSKKLDQFLDTMPVQISNQMNKNNSKQIIDKNTVRLKNKQSYNNFNSGPQLKSKSIFDKQASSCRLTKYLLD